MCRSAHTATWTWKPLSHSDWTDTDTDTGQHRAPPPGSEGGARDATSLCLCGRYRYTPQASGSSSMRNPRIGEGCEGCEGWPSPFPAPMYGGCCPEPIGGGICGRIGAIVWVSAEAFEFAPCDWYQPVEPRPLPFDCCIDGCICDIPHGSDCCIGIWGEAGGGASTGMPHQAIFRSSTSAGS